MAKKEIILKYFVLFFIRFTYAFLAYLLTNNLIITILVGICFIFAFFFYINKLYVARKLLDKKNKECLSFINSFLVSYLATSSGEASYLTSTLEISSEFNNVVSNLESYSLVEKLKYLESYFSSSLYSLFLNLYFLHEEQGGEIMNFAEPLLKQTSMIEDFQNNLKKVNIANLSQFISLNFLSIIIVILVRYCLNNYFESLQSSILYLTISSLFFFLILTGFILCSYFYFNIKINWKGNMRLWKRNTKPF